MSTAKLFSAAFYLLVFASSLFCFSLAENFLRAEKDRFVGFLLLCVGVLIPTIVAGLRADSVGLDILTYIRPNYDDVLSCSSMKEAEAAIESSGEWGYVGLVYFLSRFFDDIGPLLFALQLLTIGPFACAAFLLRDRLSPTISMMIYLFCYFNSSLNLMRQFVTIAFIVLSWSLYVKNRKFTLLIFFLLLFACLFHKSGMFGIIMVFGLMFLMRQTPHLFNLWFLICICVLVFLGVRYFEVLVDFFASMNSNFRGYADIFVYETKESDFVSNPFSAFALSRLLLDIVLVGWPVMVIKNIRKSLSAEDEILILSARMCVMGLLLYCAILFGLSTLYGMRISLYWDVFIFLFAPMAISRATNTRFMAFCYSIFLLAYWFIRTIRLDDDSVVVYMLRI